MQHYESIRRLLHRIRRRWRALRLLEASVRIALGASIVISVALVAARWLDRAPAALALIGAAALVLVCAVIAWASLPLRDVPDDGRVARFIEERAPALDDRLVSAVAVAQSARFAASPTLVEPMLSDAARRANGVDVDTIVPRRLLRGAALRAAASLGLLVFLLALARGPAAQAVDAASLTLFPSRVTLDVTPGSARINAGAPFTIAARLVGSRAPVQARVEVSAPDGWHAIAMSASEGRFTLTLPSVTASFKYRVAAGALKSSEYDVAVAYPPRVTQIDVEYSYPPARGMKPRLEEDGGDIYAPAGTDVRIRVHTDRPVKMAQLTLADGSRLALASESAAAYTGPMRVVADTSYRVALDDGHGFSNPGDTEYFIRVLEDRPPEVRILAPAADKSVTQLEEVDVEAQAQDDYGVASMDLVYAVGGGADTIVPLVSGGHAESVTGRRTLYLEDLKVQPGDIVSYYVRARDVVQGGHSSETKSDIYFLQVRSFEQEFQLAPSQMPGGASGSSIDELVNAQKDIVVATWKLDRRAEAAKGARSEADIRAVSGAEAELKTRVEQTASTFREGTMRDPRRRPSRGPGAAPKAGETLPEEDAMSAASSAMGRAVTSLDALKTAPAISPEMEALNHLMTAQAAVKRHEVSRQQTTSGAGDNNRNFDTSSLFDRELQRQQQTNYETPSSTERNDQNQNALDKIKELARRQDELLKNQQKLAQQRASLTADEQKRELEKLTREQSELRQQAEELARQLSAERSSPAQTGRSGKPGQSAGQSTPSGGEADAGAVGRQMRDVSDQMRSAASDLRREDPGKASVSGNQALETLRGLERQLQGAAPDEPRRALGEAELEARQLAEAQRQLATGLNKTPTGEAGHDEARRLAGEQERLAERAQSLQENLDRQARSSGQASPSTGSDQVKTAARAAAAELEKQQLAQRMQQAAGDLRATADGSSTKDVHAQAVAQEDIARSLDKLANGLSTSGARDGESQKLSAQLARAQDLRSRIASLGQEIQRLGQQTAASAGQPGSQSAGASSQNGESQQSGAGGMGAGSELARLQQEYARDLDQTRELIDELKRENPNDAKGGVGTTPEGQGGTMSAPGTEAFKQDFARWQSLNDQVNTALDSLEATLTKALQSKASKDRLAAGIDDKPPSEYQQQVDSYFKALAAAGKK